jgi:uncharacterized membrane protein YbhN (UPF0104 family)
MITYDIAGIIFVVITALLALLCLFSIFEYEDWFMLLPVGTVIFILCISIPVKKQTDYLPISEFKVLEVDDGYLFYRNGEVLFEVKDYRLVNAFKATPEVFEVKTERYVGIFGAPTINFNYTLEERCN